MLGLLLFSCGRMKTLPATADPAAGTPATPSASPICAAEASMFPSWGIFLVLVGHPFFSGGTRSIISIREVFRPDARLERGRVAALQNRKGVRAVREQPKPTEPTAADLAEATLHWGKRHG